MTESKRGKGDAGPLTSEARDGLRKDTFAFPAQRKEPLEDASHVRNAIARFRQVTDVTDAERDAAWRRILSAAKKFDVTVHETDWRMIGAEHVRR